MSKKPTFKPNEPEYCLPNDNVTRKEWTIRVGDKVVGTMESQIRDLNQSFSTPGYSVTVTALINDVEKPYRDNSGTFSNRSMREARENRSVYFKRAKEWAIKRLNALEKAAQAETAEATQSNSLPVLQPKAPEVTKQCDSHTASTQQIVPITEIDVYRATLEACVKAEASDQRKLANVLRSWVDASPFHGCPTCDGRAPWRNDPPCSTCNGDGFVPDSN